MAEVVGIVFSSFELIKTARELKKFVGAIKDAPAELDEVVRETAQLTRLLEVLGEQQADVNPFAIQCPEWELCRDTCHDVCKDLSTLIAELKTKINIDRWTGSMRALLKKESISALEKRLARARSNLILANQTFQK